MDAIKQFISFQNISAILTLIGLVCTVIQLWQIKRNRHKQYEQSRRELTVEMVYRYSQNINPETRIAEKIVMQLTDEQCQDLHSCTPFQVDKKLQPQLCELCPHKKECEKITKIKKKPCYTDDGTFTVKGDLLLKLRSTIIDYLNTLECVLLSWQLGIVDQIALEEQFEFLNKKRHKERALETYRTVASGGRAYPAIEKYYQYLRDKEAKEAAKSIKKIIK